jgi:hypothetical protein
VRELPPMVQILEQVLLKSTVVEVKTEEKITKKSQH